MNRKELKILLLECANIYQESWGDIFTFDSAYEWNKPFRKYLKKNESRLYELLKSHSDYSKALGVFELLDLLNAITYTQNTMNSKHPQDTKALNIFLDFCMKNKEFVSVLKTDILAELEELNNEL